MSEASPAEPPDILGSLWVRETRSIARRADRCVFVSNFPVDAMHGRFDQLYPGFD
jgi:predicted TIM-barrel fold metal-dependent hydrolase